MNRREVFAAAGAAAVALAVTPQAANADGHGKTGYLLVHGSWHGVWCWDGIASRIQNAGQLALGIDLPGSGLNAVSPPSYFKRPLDDAAFATEPSQFAKIPSDAFADSVLEGVARLRGMGADKIVAVGHSMGGMPISLAAAKEPSAINGLVFLTALTPVPGKPSGAFLALPDQAKNSLLGAIVKADPAKVGGFRIDTGSGDEKYRAAGKAALAADVPDDVWNTAVNMMSPDAPVAFYGDMVEFPAEYAAIKRTFIRCGKDMTLLPSTQDAIVAALNEAWPDNPCKVIEMDASHEAMFADPDGVAKAILSAG
ncbi:MAG: alpha/beta fold hydrolase [Pseudomonadota bacterium]